MMNELQAAYVLHSKPFRDTSIIAEMFSQTQGRLACVVRGIKNQRSEWRGMMQPFQPLWMGWQGKNELKTLSKLEPRGRALNFSGKTLYSALYLNELLIRLLEREDSIPSIFELYEHTLLQLETSQNQEALLRKFEFKLLDLLGFALTLNRVAKNNEPVEPDNFYIYLPEEGLLPAITREKFSCFRGSELLAIASEDFSNKNALQSAKILLRQALQQATAHRPILSSRIFSRRRTQ